MEAEKPLMFNIGLLKKEREEETTRISIHHQKGLFSFFHHACVSFLHGISHASTPVLREHRVVFRGV
jgi:hypothetical protein